MEIFGKISWNAYDFVQSLRVKMQVKFHPILLNKIIENMIFAEVIIRKTQNSTSTMHCA